MNDYSVKELVTEIVIPKLDAIQRDLVEKADRQRVHDIAASLAAFEKLVLRALNDKADLDDIAKVDDRIDRLESWRTWLAGFGAALILVAGITGYRLWFG